jgi:hypothetical protein
MSDDKKIRLKIDFLYPCQKGNLVYIKDEYSIFFIEEMHFDALTSLTLHTLEIMIAKDGLLSRVQGYFPILSWKVTVLPDFRSQQALVYLDESNFEIEKNMGIGQSITREWPIYYDKDKEVIFVGENISQALDCIEFCTGCYLSISNGYINGLWLKPKIIGTFPN